jgi:hypothetical protein
MGAKAMKCMILQDDGQYCASCDACGRPHWSGGAVALMGEGRSRICEVCLARTPAKVVASCLALLELYRTAYEREADKLYALMAELETVDPDQWQAIATARGNAAMLEFPDEPVKEHNEGVNSDDPSF